MLNTIAHPSRLSLLYEIMPLAFLIEKAGGAASDGDKAILDLKIEGFMQKVNFIAGSKEDVEYVSEEINQEGNVSGKKGSHAQMLAMQKKGSFIM